MAPAKSMEKATSFAMACSLLSRYVREKGAAAGEVGLGIRAEAADAQRTSADAEKGDARKETMNLFPQNAGFCSDAAGQGTPDARYWKHETKHPSIWFASVQSCSCSYKQLFLVTSMKKLL
jgi:jasmonate ZIM domain-containing protein